MLSTVWIRVAALAALYTPVTLASELAIVTEAEIVDAVRYPGLETERRLLDLARADFHAGQAAYYKDKTQSGFMACERFQLGLERAIGDIRQVAHIAHDEERKQAALKTHQNWQQAFLRAPRPNRPPSPEIKVSRRVAPKEA